MLIGSYLCTQGYGSQLAWRLFQNGVEVQRSVGIGPLLMSYMPPSGLSLSMLTGIPANPANPVQIVLTGSNLFNNCSVITAYAGMWPWSPSVCTFSNITFVTAGGGGAGLLVNVSIGNNWAIVPTPVSFSPPVINQLVAPLLPTYGGAVVSLQGK
jgi:hypothetical protein